jgi:hypothetical protein
MAEELVTPKRGQDGEWNYKTKSIMVGRLPRKNEGEYKTAIIRLFEVNNPHKTTEFPKVTLEVEDIEKIRLRNLNVSYYLEGNDIIINDLKSVKIKKEGSKIQLWAEQEEVENRATHEKSEEPKKAKKR